jgi:hypothetical protein
MPSHCSLIPKGFYVKKRCLKHKIPSGLRNNGLAFPINIDSLRELEGTSLSLMALDISRGADFAPRLMLTLQITEGSMSLIRKDFMPKDLSPTLSKNDFDGCIAV